MDTINKIVAVLNDFKTADYNTKFFNTDINDNFFNGIAFSPNTVLKELGSH